MVGLLARRWKIKVFRFSQCLAWMRCDSRIGRKCWLIKYVEVYTMSRNGTSFIETTFSNSRLICLVQDLGISIYLHIFFICLLKNCFKTALYSVVRIILNTSLVFFSQNLPQRQNNIKLSTGLFICFMSYLA